MSIIERWACNFRNSRNLVKLKGRVAKIRTLSDSYSQEPDEALIRQAQELAKSKGQPLQQLDITDALALACAAINRVHGIELYDEQIMGALALINQNVIDMKTGEGKTYVAPLAAFAMALTGEPVHVITVNDYLAARDADLMGPVFALLDMTVGFINAEMNAAQRKQAYLSNIVYATASELGFDYLRDNRAYIKEARLQRSLGFAIIDEADAVLIDGARTPLTLSGLDERDIDGYHPLGSIVERMSVEVYDEEGQKPEDLLGHENYMVDVFKKNKAVSLTDAGYAFIEQALAEATLIEKNSHLYSSRAQHYLTMIQSLLSARYVLERDVDYLVREGEVLIIDPDTGRSQPGRRWGNGLHQAVEFKEGVEIKPDSKTQANITLMAFFALYHGVCGMSGTADVEREELMRLFGLTVSVIPTHRPVIRKKEDDRVFLRESIMLDWAVDDVEECHKKGQPVLVGTLTVEMSERLSSLLSARGLEHVVLNARQHDREADIIARAGMSGAITVSTAMAGRGTDIVLGGHPDLHTDPAGFELAQKVVKEVGGLRVIGLQRSSSRRIDEQLAGRCARQGDPGETVFYVSLEDPLLKQFGGNKLSNLLKQIGGDDDQYYSHKMINRSVRSIQGRIEETHSQMRKMLLMFDAETTRQRQHIYELRNSWMELVDDPEGIKKILQRSIRGSMTKDLRDMIPVNSLEEQWELEGAKAYIKERFRMELKSLEEFIEKQEHFTDENLVDYLANVVMQGAERLEASIDEADDEHAKVINRNGNMYVITLQTLDDLWSDYLQSLQELQAGINLRAYANEKPNEAFSKSAFQLFEEFLEGLEGALAARYMNELIREAMMLQKLRSEAA